MRPLGFVLLAFNLIAGGAFVYLGLQDWRGRQEITAGGLRHVLLVRGLPFEGASESLPTAPDAEIPFKVEMAGGTTTNTVSPPFLTKYFQEAAAGDSKSPFAGNTPVASQLGELKRVRAIIKDTFDKAASRDQKARMLGALLEFQVETYAERVVIQRFVAAQNVDALAVMLDLKFQQIDPNLITAGNALAPDAWGGLPQRIEQLENEQNKVNAQADQLEQQGKAAQSDTVRAEQDLQDAEAQKNAARADTAKLLASERRAEATNKFREANQTRQRAVELGAEANLLRSTPAKTESDQRLRLAHLLTNLDPDAGWQKRVALVVGLRSYVKAIALQTQRFRQISDHIERMIYQDQEAYIAQIGQLRELAITRTEMVMDAESMEKKLREQRDKDKKFVEQRQMQLADLEKQLAGVKTDVANLLAEQTGIERELYTLQRDIAITLDEVYELQEQLGEAERKRFTRP